MSLKKTADKIIGKAVNTVTSAVSQTSSKKDRKKFAPAPGIDKACRTAAAEGMVLLKNENNILPLKKTDRLSVFGRVQCDTFFVGYGSGGDVNAHYKIGIIKGLEKNADITLNERLAQTYRHWCKKHPVDNGYWGHWPMCYEEMPVSDALCKRARDNSDVAMLVIGRAAGEDRENTLTKGSYYLSDAEERLLDTVSRYFEQYIVILNIGGVMDFSWIEKYRVPCALICWQGGMEAGNAVADVISGKISPSGKLPDSVAKTYEDLPTGKNFGNKKKNLYTEDIFVGYRYFETFAPDRVLFPFGYGLTYSDFSLSRASVQKTDTAISVRITCKNIGSFPAAETVQLYFSAAHTDSDMPAIQLVAFAKTAVLIPGEEEDLHMVFPLIRFAAYDDAGKTGFCNGWVLQKGEYTLKAGFSSRNLTDIFSFVQKNNELLEQLSEAAAPEIRERLMRLTKLHCHQKTYKTYSPAPCKTIDLRQKIAENLPKPLDIAENKDITLNDVLENRASLEEFVSVLTEDELEALTRGDYVMNSPLGPRGNAGVFGGVLPSLREKGVPPITCTDGPSGIRLSSSSALLPNGTCLASTFNPALIEKVYRLLGQEMRERGADVLLAPGMNIHRDPLCGRNFEYFSEDPFLTGVAGAAVVTGLQTAGVSACPKHFACNNQETNRIHNNSVLSQRALREIYLRGFEYCVKNAKPYNLMTSYNKINGVWGHYHYELVTQILRKEWGYQGNVMTDWWMRKSESPEFPGLRDQAYRIRAGVDVLMPGGERVGKKEPDGTVKAALALKNGLSRAEPETAALHVLNYAIIKLRSQQNENYEF